MYRWNVEENMAAPGFLKQTELAISNFGNGTQCSDIGGICRGQHGGLIKGHEYKTIPESQDVYGRYGTVCVHCGCWKDGPYEKNVTNSNNNRYSNYGLGGGRRRRRTHHKKRSVRKSRKVNRKRTRRSKH